MLEETNAIIAEENTLLRTQLEQLKSFEKDSSGIVREDSVSQYEFITAKIINNSTHWINNTLTINRGLKDGININMGVLGNGGVVGKVRYSSNRYSVITSLLHSRFTISSRIKDKVELCTTEWEGQDPGFVTIKFVPRHHNISVGDSVLTSGYNAIFPPNIPIAVVSDIQIKSDDTFYTIKAKLVNDFTKLNYVHIVVNRFKTEKDSIENLINRNE
jgi:rod shape-determining protein MreC